MATRNVIFALDQFYHVYNRGVDKRTIFLDSNDYRRFIELLYIANSTMSVSIRNSKKNETDIFNIDRGDPLVAIGAWCLMPNHFHILVTPLVENGLSKFMGKLTTGYPMYFNKKHDRSGSLFQGMFKAEHADTDEYLKYLYSYIHLNPLKLIDPDWKEKGVKDATKAYNFVASFQYSSLRDYLGDKRKESAIINPSYFPEYFSNADQIKAELFEWINYSK